MDFVKIFNITLTEAKYKEPEALATSLNDTMEELNIDSLDCMLISSLLADVFGISEEKIDGMPMTSLTDLQTYINKHKTKDVESEEAVLAAVA